MENQFNFIFELDKRVVTPFGDEGIVSMLGFDDGGRKYHVQTAKTSDWFKESQLKPVIKYGSYPNPIDHFINDGVVKFGEGVGACVSSVYSVFKCHCEVNKFEPVGLKRFVVEMKEKGWLTVKDSEGVMCFLNLFHI